MTVKRINPGPRMSNAVVHNGVVYVQGFTADDVSADLKGQTKEILAKIDAVLKEAGSDKSKLLSATVWISDMRHFAEMNAVWDAWVAPGNTPGRACVEARLAAPHWKVEIAVVAARD